MNLGVAASRQSAAENAVEDGPSSAQTPLRDERFRESLG